jgi:tRNA A-37 threonylcarbamoyl transferase component Bud32
VPSPLLQISFDSVDQSSIASIDFPTMTDEVRSIREESLADAEGNQEEAPTSTATSARDDFWQLVKLKLKLTTSIPSIRDSPTVRPFAHVTKLDLAHCGLQSLPDDFGEALPQLSILFLSHNAFSELPPVIGSCPHLQMVAFKSNRMTRIHPDALQAQLRWLILTDNQLEELPETIGRCTSLQKCMLAGNRLTALPESMACCTALELLRLSSNRLTSFPTCLRKLPRLAWLALADNSFLDELSGAGSTTSTDDVSSDKEDEKGDDGDSGLPCITDLPDTATGEILGQGAGGITRKLKDGQGRTVAVKQFGGAMTSDGLPAAERRMAKATAQLQRQSSALIQVLGQTPEGSLVMEYLDGYQALAKPPSLQTCSRDVYETDTEADTESSVNASEDPARRRWSFSQAEPVVTALVEALTSLHRAGLTHGDFYSHNILVKEKEEEYGVVVDVKLSDFGAAYAYDRQADYAHVVEQCEVRALHIWLTELNKHLLEQPSLRVDALLQAKTDGRLVTMEQVLVHWRQGQLAALAKAFDPDEENQEQKQEV